MAGVSVFSAIHFYPRSPRGERLAVYIIRQAYKDISIHAPRVGSDRDYAEFETWGAKFLSTLPAWGATALFS